MPANVSIDFLKRKLAEHGIRKVVPDRDLLERHARRVVEQRLIVTVLRENRAALRAKAVAAALPDDLDDQVRSMLACKPELSWDDAVSALILKGIA